MTSEIKYDKFNWHFGVVEDRLDPLKLGRVRVRFFGVHTDDKSKVPTESLPWATPINPVFSASVSGIGGPHTGLVEGSWVVGFFADQDSYQKPFIMGSIAGIPDSPPDTESGFNDPFGVFPKSAQSGYNGLNESDLPRLARGGTRAEGHESLGTRRESAIQEIPTARAYKVDAVQDPKADEYYIRGEFDEPLPQGVDASRSIYPFNKVTETESGHVVEFDDTPDYERIHEYHTSGSYREIVADGTTTQKVVGDGFDIIVKDKNVYVGGNCNITIMGSSRLLVKGDMITEVDGNYFLTVRKDKIEKIQGNHITEILSDRNTQINGNNAIRITGNDTTNIIKNENITIGGNHTETIVGNTDITTQSNKSETILGNSVDIIAGTKDVGVVKKYSMATADVLDIKSTLDMNITTDANQNETVAATQTITAATQNITANTGTIDYTDGSIDVVSGNITDTTVTLHTHTHATTSMDTGTGANSGKKNESDSPTAST